MPTNDRPWFVSDSGSTDRLSDDDKMVFMRVRPGRFHPPHPVIFRGGEPAEHLHVVARGRLELVRRPPDEPDEGVVPRR